MRILKALAATAAALTFSVQAQAAEFEFKMHHLLPAKAPAHSKMLEPWARQVEANSGGRIKIEIFPAMTLGGKPPELISQARDGVVDIVWTVNGYTPGLFPATEVFELPGVYKNDVRATNMAMCEMFDTDLRSEGGFNRSSQHPNLGGVDDDGKTKIRKVHAAQIVLTRTAPCLAARATVPVLAGYRGRAFK